MKFNLDEYTRQIIDTVEKYNGNERFVLVANLIAEAHNKGKIKGHNLALDMCDISIKKLKEYKYQS